MAAAEDGQHIVKSRAILGGDKANPLRQGRNGTLALRREQTFLFKFGFQLLKGELKAALSLGLHMSRYHLETTLRRGNPEPAIQDKLKNAFSVLKQTTYIVS